MAIHLLSAVKKGLGTVSRVVVIDTQQSFENFQKLVQQGSSLYPDLPAEVKTFADEVTLGFPAQHYEDGKADAAIQKEPK
ncbi:hypothetical protein Tiera_034 [Polaromonas phage Tiera]|nr:hypothetical protein Tiera_034 [Polaromonas phage Tiera]